MERVLFLCTGNYYRSRFAEEYFNFKATITNLGWRADSRGLRQNMNTLRNVGPISRDTLKRLQKLRINPIMAARFPLPVEIHDFQRATQVIAMSEAEHRPMMADLFPMFEETIDYWDVEDFPLWQPEQTLLTIERRVDSLVEELALVA